MATKSRIRCESGESIPLGDWRAAADVVLIVYDVTKVGVGIAIGQRMLRIAKQSIFFGMGASFVLMGIAAFGFIQPAMGAIMQEVLDVVVILNALRVR